MVIVVVFIAGVFLWRELSYYQSFNEVIEPQWNEESEVLGGSILINDNATPPVLEKELEINDSEEMEEILEHFSDLDLKKDPEARPASGKYELVITTNNAQQENYSRTDSFRIEFGDDYLVFHIDHRNSGHYEIRNENPDHLAFFEELNDNQELEWKLYE